MTLALSGNENEFISLPKSPLTAMGNRGKTNTCLCKYSALFSVSHVDVTVIVWTKERETFLTLEKGSRFLFATISFGLVKYFFTSDSFDSVSTV